MIHISQPPVRNYAKIKTGTYTGDGTDDRNINIGVDLSGKNNVYIIVKDYAPSYPTHRIEYGQGDLSMLFNNSADQTNHVQQLTSTGFEVGSSTYVNTDTNTYRYIAIWEEP